MTMTTNSNKDNNASRSRRSKSTESLRASASSVPPLRVPPEEEEEDVPAAAVRLSRSKRMMARIAASSTRVRVHAHEDKLGVLRALRARRLQLQLLRPRLVYLHTRLRAADKLPRARKPGRIKRHYDISPHTMVSPPFFPFYCSFFVSDFSFFVALTKLPLAWTLGL